MVRKKLSAREGRGWLSGTLFCTHFRVAFVPQDSPKPDVRPSAQLLDASQQNPSSHVLLSPCHAGQCRPGAPGGSRRGFGLYWEGGGRWVKLLKDLLFFNCCTTSKSLRSHNHKVLLKRDGGLLVRCFHFKCWLELLLVISIHLFVFLLYVVCRWVVCAGKHWHERCTEENRDLFNLSAVLLV